jgi:hypothetical protein
LFSPPFTLKLLSKKIQVPILHIIPTHIWHSSKEKVLSKAWFPYGRNCRDRVVTVVRVVATQWQQFTTVRSVLSSSILTTVAKMCCDGYILMVTEKQQHGNSFVTIGRVSPLGGLCSAFENCRQLLVRSLGTKLTCDSVMRVTTTQKQA